MIRKSILKISKTDYVRSAIEEQADLSAFKEKPTPLVVAGIMAIVFSFIIGWPAVAACGILAVKLHNPWIAAIGGPLTYGLSHVVFLLGMYLSGAVYSLMFFRWLIRITMEPLLFCANLTAPPRLFILSRHCLRPAWRLRFLSRIHLLDY